MALSTPEAKYMATLDCSKDVVWFCRLIFILTQFPLSPTVLHLPPTSLFNKNNGAVFLLQEAALNSRSKHIDIHHHYVEELVKNQIFQPQQIDTKKIPAEYLTKAAGNIFVDNCCCMVWNISLLELKEGSV